MARPRPSSSSRPRPMVHGRSSGPSPSATGSRERKCCTRASIRSPIATSWARAWRATRRRDRSTSRRSIASRTPMARNRHAPRTHRRPRSLPPRRRPSRWRTITTIIFPATRACMRRASCTRTSASRSSTQNGITSRTATAAPGAGCANRAWRAQHRRASSTRRCALTAAWCRAYAGASSASPRPACGASTACLMARRSTSTPPSPTPRRGGAIPHAMRKLRGRESRTKLLVLLSDGRPFDLDYGQQYGEGAELEYALHDTRQALLEAREARIKPFVLTVDPQGNDYLRAMCDGLDYEVLDDVAQLPARLVSLVQGLAA